MMGQRIFTIGHSTLELEAFLAALERQEVRALADVRRFPGSRRHPQFGGEALRNAVEERGIAYRWFEDLGGRRSTKDLSLDNAAWRVAAFHAYADWMRSPVFHGALGELEMLARERASAVMCAEALWTRCHRRLISDALVARGWEVTHILPPARLEPHRPPEFARFVGEGVSYPLPLMR